jgi:hypothetical protein
MNKNITATEGLIKSLEQAIDYEKGKRIKGVKSNTITIVDLPHYKENKIKPENKA